MGGRIEELESVMNVHQSLAASRPLEGQQKIEMFMRASGSFPNRSRLFDAAWKIGQ
jgi:hypothetical protein